MIRQQLLPAQGSENVIQQALGMGEMVRDSLSSEEGIVETAEKFLLVLTDWQRHLSSPLLPKRVKEQAKTEKYIT